MKGETPEELRSILLSLRKHATKITPKVNGSLIDTCGTGGDSRKSFNISTAALSSSSSLPKSPSTATDQLPASAAAQTFLNMLDLI